ncbi:UV excision repair protein RAD23 homolog A isoform X2 [Drosophila teissieri]|uniref:UV excision repair protein RAD23 homolog A isoform X2 n=1 Tax=Drosophila teissieri TaxID=7243 RepID=UPI001CB9EFD6|nr:UV excision repair protein RAD23 homolog A isoform X2 [Drosophila teissieri]XP_043657676.1 UV excision repair protein RAD23 homolog A isoform X2 [Drosophila teissieri]
MIITIKNLQQQTFTIEFAPEKTVLELKKKIFDERGPEYVAEKQKLIYAGVILTDDRTVGSYNVDEKKFIVVMLTRDSSSSNTNQLSVKESDKLTSTNDLKDSMPREESNHSNSPVTRNSEESILSSETGPISTDNLIGELAQASLQSRAESNLLMGDEYNQTVLSMVEMGYPREQAERAMAASYNNPERAVEYLINGIPAEEGTIDNDVNESTNPSVIASGPQTGSASSVERPSESNSDPFEFLRSQPQFLQMRSLIYQNPHLLHAVLQQIGQTNPALLQLISENQDAFLNMLNQPIERESESSATVPRVSSARTHSTLANVNNLFSSDLGAATAQRSTAATSAAQQSGSAAENEDLEQPLGVSTIRLNRQDQDAIERLKALGFPETLVVQAYFACEKNEELAANFLLSSSFDD